MNDSTGALACLILIALWIPISIFSALGIAYILHKLDLDHDSERGE